MSIQYTSKLLAQKNIFPALVLVTVGAIILRLYHIDSQLWSDEISALFINLRMPWYQIVSEGHGGAPHILYSLLAHLSLVLFGESPTSIRLPAALFGIASVPMIYLLSRIISGRGCALFTAALFAVSYHHIFYSQNARGYTTLIFFFILTSYLFLLIAKSKSVSLRLWISYVIGTVLLCYSQPFGVFIPVAQSIVALGLAIKRKSVNPFPLKNFIIAMSFAAVGTLILYAPHAMNMFNHASMNMAAPEEGPRIGLWLLLEIAEGLSRAFFGYTGLAIASVIGLFGLFTIYRRHPVSVYVLLLPPVVQGVVFIIMNVGIYPRYFSNVLPVVYIMGAYIIYASVQYLLALLPVREPIKQWGLVSILTVIVAISSLPLSNYYRYPKQDFIGAMIVLNEEAGPRDIKLAVQTAGSILIEYYNADVGNIQTLKDLHGYEQKGQKIWIVTTLERIMAVAEPNLISHIHEKYILQKELPGTLGDGSMRIYSSRD